VRPPGGVLETSLYAADLAAARRFYAEVLGLPLIAAEAGRHVFFRCGEGVLLVFDPEATASPGRTGPAEVPAHGACGPGHVAFAVREADLPAWRERLEACGVPIEAEVAWPRGGRSLYFRDPAGNSLELTSPRVWGLAETRERSP
jgi:catechol 2,3-dioxygenase-like lactoylglutathione lyase family enzyme